MSNHVFLRGSLSSALWSTLLHSFVQAGEHGRHQACPGEANLIGLQAPNEAAFPPLSQMLLFELAKEHLFQSPLSYSGQSSFSLTLSNLFIFSER